MKQFIAQFHPLLVHLPIGIFVTAILFKILSLRWKGSKYEGILPILIGSTFLASLASAVSGYLLFQGGGYEETLADNHKWSGFVFTLMTGILWILVAGHYRASVQNIMWTLCTIGLFITGHLGGSLTHGSDYLNFSFQKYSPPVVTNIDSALVYHDVIEPILAAKCWSCHSAVKKKGALRLDGIDHIIRGGKHGDVIASQPDQSKMYHRITLPKSADDHMPPSGKPQLTSEEVKLIEWWLLNNATTDRLISEAQTSTEIRSILEEIVDQTKDKAPMLLPDITIPPADRHQSQLLDSAGILAVPIAQNTNYLSIIINPTKFQPNHWELIKNISDNIAWFTAKGIQLNDTAVQVILGMHHLIKLDLTQTSLNDNNLKKLNSLSELRSLNVSGTSVTENGLKYLDGLKSLQTLYAFQSKVNPASWSALKKQIPALDTGNYRVPFWVSDTSRYTYDQLAIDKKIKEELNQ